MTIIIIIALLLGGGGVSFSAESSLPGDVLYPIKIHVNENIQEIVAVSNESEAKVQAKFATRRLKEAEMLTMKGKLSQQISAELAVRFGEHAQKTRDSLVKMSQKENVKMEADFQTELRSHEGIIFNLEQANPETSISLTPVLDAIRLEVNREKSVSEECPEVEMMCPGNAPMSRGPNCEIICGNKEETDIGVTGEVTVDSSDSSTDSIGVGIIYPDQGNGGKACTQEAKLCPDGSAVGRTGPNCEFSACPSPNVLAGNCRTDRDCQDGYECIDASPVVRIEMEQLRCWKKGAPTPICLAPDTHIATPKGDIPVKDMKEGMSVWTVDTKGNKVAGTVILSGRMLAPAGHKVMHIALRDGKELFVSPGHKVADGREAGAIKTGDILGGVPVILAELIPYGSDYTYDILPGGSTGMYFANGILLQSTLK